MIDTEKILQSFQPIYLNEIGDIQLTDRFDSKYLFNNRQLNDVLKHISADYFVLTIQNRVTHRYFTTYFDYQDNRLYQAHHDKLDKRFKIRVRQYVDEKISFLEVKSKAKKEKTIKNRLKIDEPNILKNKIAQKFIQDHSDALFKDLQSSLFISFSRITLVNKNRKERLTFDTQLDFSYNGVNHEIPYLVIAESKKESREEFFSFEKYAESLKIPKQSISKYCIGRILTDNTLENSRFKSKLEEIEKINNDVV